jgi:hypothetical protein
MRAIRLSVALIFLATAHLVAQDSITANGPSDLYQGHSMYVQLTARYAGTTDHIYFKSVTTPTGVTWRPICTGGSGPTRDACWITTSGQEFQWNEKHNPWWTNLRYTAEAGAPVGEFVSVVTVTTNGRDYTITVPLRVLPRPTPPIQRAFPSTIPDIPGLKTWETIMTAQGQSRCPPPGTQFAFGAESSQANPSTMWYYDGGKVYLQIADYTGNHTTFDQCAYTILAAYRDHVLAGGEASHAWHVFPHGLRMAYERTKDDRYKLAVHQLAYNTLVSPQAGVLNGLTWGQYFDPMLPGTPESGIRELAYITQAYIASEQLGEPRHPQLSRAVDSLLGHFDVLFRNHTWALHQTFYDGLAAAALIEYFELTKAESPDWRIPEAIRQMCDWIWDRAYDQNRHQLVYNPDPSGLTCKATGDPTADCQTYNTILINLVAPAFAWYWSITGDETYLQRGDELFQHALDTEPWSTKEFNQAYRWSFDYVKWRTRGRPVGGGAIDHVSVASASVTGGSPVSGTVFLRDVAASTTTVTLSQSGGAALQLPTSVDVPAGAQSAQFSLVTPAVSASQIVTITARLGETSAGINLTVMPPAVASVYIASELKPGKGSIAVYLNAPAPPGGSTVRLASSNPAVIVLPSDVTFPAGTSRLNVPIVVNTVTAPTSVTISATLGKTVSATTTCQPKEK